MTPRPNLLRLIVLFSLLLFCGDRSQAWNPIAHYEIAKEAGHAALAPYAQLPDYTDSWGIRWFKVRGQLKDGFLWGHALQSNGLTWQAPVTPLDPDDGRYPEQIMWNLIQKKLKGLTDSDKAEMEKTAKGWLIHNAADRVVHFGIFPGAEAGDDLPAAINKWLNHRRKEEWADIWLYICKHNLQNTPEEAFDPPGVMMSPEGYPMEIPPSLRHLQLMGDYAQGVPMAAPTMPMAKIIQLAQKESRKDRYSLSGTEPSVFMEPETLTTLISSINDTLRTPYGTQNLRLRYNLAKYRKLKARADENGWTDEMLASYDKAVANMNAWMETLK